MTELLEAPSNDASSNRHRSLLLSIKPKYVAPILTGIKTIELRRTRPAVGPGATVVIYASTPTKAIVGHAELVEVIEGVPSIIRSLSRDHSAVADSDFDAYFAGSETAVGLRLTKIVTSKVPLTLEKLRLLGIEPPQSWRYLEPNLLTLLQHRL